MTTYIINKREYKEAERDAKEGDKVVSKVDFIGGMTQEDNIVEVSHVFINEENHDISFQDAKGLWCFTSKDQYRVLEPTNLPISNADEILLLEEELADANEQIDKLHEGIADLNEAIDILMKRTQPLVNLSELFKIAQ